MEPVEILGIDTRIGQVVATLMAALGAGLIAAVAAWIAYRNAFGWAPLINWLSVERGTVGDDAYFGCKFEVFNRHKYPIDVYVVRVSVWGDEFRRLPSISRRANGWYGRCGNSKAELLVSAQLKAGERRKFKLKHEVYYGLWRDPRVEVAYFDPVKGRRIEISNEDTWLDGPSGMAARLWNQAAGRDIEKHWLRGRDR